jgi:TrmH RNA methyltransferase
MTARGPAVRKSGSQARGVFAASAALPTHTICGRRAVVAALEARPGDVVRLFFAAPERATVAQALRELAQRRALYRELPDAELTRVAGSRAHQGLVAVLQEPPVPVLDLATVAAWARTPGLRLGLDGVANPHNLGALARTAAFLGVFDLAVAGPGADALRSGAVYRTAEGAMEALSAWRATDLAGALRAFTESGGLAVGLDVAATGDLADLRGVASQRSCWVVAGSEELGLATPVRAACSQVVAIAGSGRVQSLNVGAATAIALAWLR